MKMNMNISLTYSPSSFGNLSIYYLYKIITSMGQSNVPICVLLVFKRTRQCTK